MYLGNKGHVHDQLRDSALQASASCGCDLSGPALGVWGPDYIVKSSATGHASMLRIISLNLGSVYLMARVPICSQCVGQNFSATGHQQFSSITVERMGHPSGFSHPREGCFTHALLSVASVTGRPSSEHQFGSSSR